MYGDNEDSNNDRNEAQLEEDTGLPIQAFSNTGVPIPNTIVQLSENNEQVNNENDANNNSDHEDDTITESEPITQAGQDKIERALTDVNARPV